MAPILALSFVPPVYSGPTARMLRGLASPRGARHAGAPTENGPGRVVSSSPPPPYRLRGGGARRPF